MREQNPISRHTDIIGLTARPIPDWSTVEMPRSMADVEFRALQEKDRYAPHVRPINEMIDSLRDLNGRGWMPHVAPLHGGAEARVLSVLRDPGPKTQDEVGSGFLCVENEAGLTVIATYHPSRQALRSSDPAVRQMRADVRIEAYRQVADALR